MQFSETTNNTGMVQQFEYWTRLPYGSTGNRLKTITNRINAGYDHIMPLLLSYSDYLRWDDPNHTDRPSGKFDLTSGQHDYKFAEDDNGLDILNITSVSILPSATATDYKTLERMYPDHKNYHEAIAPNPSTTGVPTHYVEVGAFLFMYPNPNYSATSGGRIIFEREQYRFLSTDTTKEPGVPKMFAELPVLYGALDYNQVHRPDDISLQNSIKERIARKERDIFDLISMKAPTRASLEIVGHSNK